MAEDIASVVRTSYAAFVRKDRAMLESIVAEDFHFSSPLDNRLDRATYLQVCWPNSEAITHFEFVNFVPDGDRVFVTYEARTKDGRRFRNTEISTVRGGKLVEVEVYFGWSIPHPAPPGKHVDDASK